jgi:hypothetical protein
MPTEDYRSSLRTSRIRNLVSVTGQSVKSQGDASSSRINFVLGRLTYKQKNTNGIFMSRCCSDGTSGNTCYKSLLLDLGNPTNTTVVTFTINGGNPSSVPTCFINSGRIV